MPIASEPRVALYFDFDNIVISRYDQLHGESAYRKDTSRSKAAAAGSQTAARLTQATVDVDAVLDFAATFGTIAIARAYADWSSPVNASYRGQLIDRAVDLVQLFPLSATKNGADIRLSVDAVEDMFRIDDLSHLVIVAGDSDYVALAQKAKRLGRYVVGIGVAGGTSRALTAACDEYADYDALLQTDAAVDADEAAAVAVAPPATTSRSRRSRTQVIKADAAPPAGAGEVTTDAAPPAQSSPQPNVTSPEPSASSSAPADEDAGVDAGAGAESTSPTRNPGRLLLKALELMRAKNDDEWQTSGAVKNQMLRMDPSFQERRLGFASFTDFLKSRGGVVELDESGQNRVRIRPKKA